MCDIKPNLSLLVLWLFFITQKNYLKLDLSIRSSWKCMRHHYLRMTAFFFLWVSLLIAHTSLKQHTGIHLMNNFIQKFELVYSEFSVIEDICGLHKTIYCQLSPKIGTGSLCHVSRLHCLLWRLGLEWGWGLLTGWAHSTILA